MRKSPACPIETLESRRHLDAANPPRIVDITADNRGEVMVWFSEPVNGLNATNIRAFTGTDPVGTRLQTSNFRFDASRNVLKFNVAVQTDAPYRVQVRDGVTDNNNNALDGEYRTVRSKVRTGDGTAGGDFNTRFTAPNNTTPFQVRMNTNLGDMVLTMRPDVAFRTVQNFLEYTNTGRYDNIFFTRNARLQNGQPFVIQGGSLQINSRGRIVETELEDPVRNEGSNPGRISNTRGTVALAQAGGDGNSGTNQFFFNLGDNSQLDSTAGGGFVVFAQLTSQRHQRVMDRIATAQTATFWNPRTERGLFPPTSFRSTGTDEVPLLGSGFEGGFQILDIGSSDPFQPIPPTTGFVVTALTNPFQALIVISRTAVQMTGAPLSVRPLPNGP